MVSASLGAGLLLLRFLSLRKAKRDLSFARASPGRKLVLSFSACILRAIIIGLSK